MKETGLLTVALALTSFASAADANMLVNGSFEQPGTGCHGMTTTLPGWSVSKGNIDLVDAVCSEIVPAAGAYLVDLLGTGSAGTISQNFATTVGRTYSVGFSFGGNPQWQYLGYPNDSPVKSMNALIDGDIAATYSIDTTGQSYIDAGWTYRSFDFTATSAATTLAFASLNLSGVYGPLLDGVTVEQARIPEPASLALLAIGLAVFGLTGRQIANR